ncbi:MAG: hypothetical protein GXO87_03145 [Chlorobi bacterium]|nr:hypothetical protein [Chlorobiota bacterium]
MKTNAQKQDSLYRINAELGIGPSFYFTAIAYDKLKNNYPVTLSFRLMWKPEHKLSLGIETGYIPLYFLKTKFYDTVFGSTDAKLQMTSVPIMAVFAMTIVENFRIFGGIGGFVLTSNTESFGNAVGGSSWSNAYELGLSYLYPLSDKLKIGGEVKSFYIVRVENYALIFNVAFKYSLFSY